MNPYVTCVRPLEDYRTRLQKYFTDSDMETVALSTNPHFIELIERSRTRVRAEGGISSDDMRRRFE